MFSNDPFKLSNFQEKTKHSKFMLTQNFSFLPLVLSENKKILFICLHFLIVSMYTLRNPKNFCKYILNNHNKRPMANGAQNLLYKVIIFYAVTCGTCGTCDILFFNMWCQSWSVAHSEHRMNRLTLGQRAGKNNLRKNLGS